MVSDDLAAPQDANASKKPTASPRTQLVPHHLAFGGADRFEHPTGRELFGRKNFKTLPGLAANSTCHTVKLSPIAANAC